MTHFRRTQKTSVKRPPRAGDAVRARPKRLAKTGKAKASGTAAEHDDSNLHFFSEESGVKKKKKAEGMADPKWENTIPLALDGDGNLARAAGDYDPDEFRAELVRKSAGQSNRAISEAFALQLAADESDEDDPVADADTPRVSEPPRPAAHASVAPVSLAPDSDDPGEDRGRRR